MGLSFAVEHLFWVGFVGAAGALIFSAVQAGRVLKLPEAGETRELSRSVRKGTRAFLLRLSSVALPLFLLAFLLLLGLFFLGLPGQLLLPLSFLSGGLLSALAFLGAVFLSTRANSRTALAVQEGGLRGGFNAAFTAGTSAAFLTVGLGLLEVTAWFFVLKYAMGYAAQAIVEHMILFGAGASFAALLLRLCSGIFAKASDLSAGPAHGEEGEPAELRRGPSVISDCVGDNAAGAALHADLYGVYVMALTAALYAGRGAYPDYGVGWNTMLFPLAVAAIGTLCALGASLLVKAGENAGEQTLETLLHKAGWVCALLTAAVAAPVSYLLLGSWAPWCAVAIGLLTGQAVGFFSVRSSSRLHRPSRHLATAAESGVSRQLTVGAGLGMRFSAGLLALLATVMALAFLVTGGRLNTAFETLYAQAFSRGLYGVALAGVGLVSTLGFPLSAASYAPIADNADAMARVAGLEPAIRSRAAILNSLGGGAAAVARNLTVCVTLLFLPALFPVYSSLVLARAPAFSMALRAPTLLMGGLDGAILFFLFVSLTFSGVENCVQPVAAELRRKLREARGRAPAADPDFVSCVDLCARSAALHTTAPALLALAAPLLVGLLTGPEGTAGFLGAVAVLGLGGALLLSASGTAWDSARRQVEANRRSSSEARRASAVGDSVGDLFKDVTGPSLCLLVRLCFTSALLFSSLTAGYNLVSRIG